MHVDLAMLTTIVGTYKGRAIAVRDIKGVCLNAKMDKLILLKLIGEQVDVTHSISDTHI